MERTALIIPAGGIGKRLGGEVPKQYLELNSVPIFIHTIKNFEKFECIEACIIAAHPEWHEYIYDKIELFKVKIPVYCVENGTERQFSVHNALKSKYCDNIKYVLIHDAVRPFITKQLIKDIFAELEQFQAVIPAIPAKDTIKMMNDDGTVQSTLDRSKLCMVQTPQAFHKDAIVKAFDTAINLGFLGTDDASIAEFCGIPVKVIPGLPENIKITDRQDLINAEKR